jgi:hypothetical protein
VEGGGASRSRSLPTACSGERSETDHGVDGERARGSQYLLLRRPRVTVDFLDGSFIDCRSHQNYSLLVTADKTYAVREEDLPELRRRLLVPPLRFALSLVTPGHKNELHLALVNDFCEVRADTELCFLADGRVLSYSVYELTEAEKTGSDGRWPGVRLLCDLFRMPRYVEPPPEARRAPSPKGGRPEPLEDGKVTKRMVRASGVEVGHGL